jgi:hypothetical protein
MVSTVSNIMLSDFYSEHAVTIDSLPGGDKSPGIDATRTGMRVAMLSGQLNGFGEPYICLQFQVTSLTLAGMVHFDRLHDLSSVTFPLPC